jgi:hypothetical protein
VPVLSGASGTYPRRARPSWAQSLRPESNRRQSLYKSVALPAELRRQRAPSESRSLFPGVRARCITRHAYGARMGFHPRRDGWIRTNVLPVPNRARTPNCATSRAADVVGQSRTRDSNPVPLLGRQVPQPLRLVRRDEWTNRDSNPGTPRCERGVIPLSPSARVLVAGRPPTAAPRALIRDQPSPGPESGGERRTEPPFLCAVVKVAGA